MLQLIDVSQSFLNGARPVLRHINLHLKPGDFCVVIGSNGSGKSTLMKLISGEYIPTQGRIMMQGRGITRHDVASVVQDVNKGTVVEMTLLENMALSLARIKKRGFSMYARQKNIVIEQLKAFNMGLEQYIHTPLSHLSGGQRQMVATMMALLSQPKLLLLDEHTSAIDPCMQKVLMAYTQRSIQQQNLTSLMITHHLEDAIQYGNRLIMLHKGKIVLDVQHQEKSALSVTKLLDLFHDYEHIDLIGEA
ncbi:MAG: ATP-binding cassette domain-containing protein [Legionellaceae bacterium]|jgi:putative ABC transport system ATP-binding protein|nr:ATP-binding cassette domain-containing protein [Legionellaceae bacterium]